MQGRLVERGEGRWAVEFPRDDGTSEPAVLPIEANHGTAQHALKLLQAHALIRAGQDAAARPLLRDLEGNDEADVEELRHTSQEKLVAMLKAAIHEHEGEPPPAPPAPHQAPSLLLPPTASLGTENAGSTPGQQPVDMEIDQGGSDVDADSASEFLGVRRRQACSFSSGGDAALRWEAALQLQLDAAGVPASGAAPRSVVVATTTELEAALARDMCCLWEDAWCGPDLALISNFAMRLLVLDWTLWRALSELPTWSDLEAYIRQLQAGGFLLQAAGAYSDECLPPQPWPDPPDPPLSSSQQQGSGVGKAPGPRAAAARRQQQQQQQQGTAGGVQALNGLHGAGSLPVL